MELSEISRGQYSHIRNDQSSSLVCSQHQHCFCLGHHPALAVVSTLSKTWKLGLKDQNRLQSFGSSSISCVCVLHCRDRGWSRDKRIQDPISAGIMAAACHYWPLRSARRISSDKLFSSYLAWHCWVGSMGGGRSWPPPSPHIALPGFADVYFG